MHYTVIKGDEERSFQVAEKIEGNVSFNEEGAERSTSADIRFLTGNRVHLVIDGHSYDATVDVRGHSVRCAMRGHVYQFEIYDDRELRLMRLESATASASDPEIRSPMAGKVIDVRVTVGEFVEAGAPLVVIEAMKMENLISAPHDGTVEVIDTSTDEAVENGARLLVLTPPTDPNPIEEE